MKKKEFFFLQKPHFLNFFKFYSMGTLKTQTNFDAEKLVCVQNRITYNITYMDDDNVFTTKCCF